MKKNNILYAAFCLPLLLVSCNDFLDTMPDNRAEVNSAAKITSLLVSAYPTNSITLITELSSDNAKDNGAQFSPYNREQEDAYLWNDITTTDNDAPKAIWDAHYSAIAAANQALYAIEELGSPQSLNPQKGEALIARAYSHFMLANLFCLAYNPATATSDLGLPYSLTPETAVSIAYKRGTMEELYKKIDADIEAGLPLINDEVYSVPKYHFNKKAAYAFAARFNLYYLKFEKVIKHSNVVLGDVPQNTMRNWSAIGLAASDWSVRCNLYINASEAGNLLILPAATSWPYVHGPYNIGRRYGHARPIFMNESARAIAPWGAHANTYFASAAWGYDEKLSLPKQGAHFEYTDKQAGIGILHHVAVPFTGDETLLCRAEAYILNSQLTEGAKDINTWMRSHCRPTVKVDLITKDSLIRFYNKLPYMEPTTTADNKRAIKKHLNPLGFTVAAGDQEALIQCILHLRRIETIHEGTRWADIKRYGIEFSHNRDGLADDLLKLDDPRRAIQLPQDVINAGLAANPRK